MVQNTDSSIIRRKERKDLQQPSIIVFITGSFAAVVCAILLQPLDVLKTRLQNPDIPLKRRGAKYRMIDVLRHIYRHENLRALWYGTTATITRGIPASGLYFCIYDWLMANVIMNRTPTTTQHMAIAVVARAFSGTAVIPLSVVKTRLESGIFQYANVFSGVKHIYRMEGMAGLTSGLLPVLARDLPMSGSYIFVYNQSQHLLLGLHGNKILIDSTCAGISAILSTLITHPPDVLKTQMQLFPRKNPDIFSVIKNTYREHGFQGFYQGMAPRLFKRTIFALVSWTLYENVKTI